MSDTQQRIASLVQSNDVVLFMKGTASFPQCGFSGRAIQILKGCGLDGKTIATVNVLEDQLGSYSSALADILSKLDALDGGGGGGGGGRGDSGGDSGGEGGGGGGDGGGAAAAGHDGGDDGAASPSPSTTGGRDGADVCFHDRSGHS